TPKNAGEQRGYVRARSQQQIDQLVAYVSQIDNELPVRLLPFESSLPTGQGGAGGGPMIEGGTGPINGGCACSVRDPDLSGPGSILICVAFGLAAIRRR